ncbi:hypothetical protein CFBP6109_03124 [Pseudomonas syringae pv. cerasicola]|nr:hypothetical protein CFBP6109_03124 [Pseudomonas syringae pv. cerasicola]SPF14713.1 hypothetical protein PSCFBP6110_02209 [Pseudomonas syringae pv. cerasicola]
MLPPLAITLTSGRCAPGFPDAGLECPTALSCNAADTLIRTVSVRLDCYL